MAQQLQHRSYPEIAGSENISPTRPAGTPSTPFGSKYRDVHARSCLEELNVGALQNVQHPAHDTTPLNRYTKTAAAFPVNTATPDSLAEDLSNFHIYSPGKECDGLVRSSEIVTRQSPDGQKRILALASSASNPVSPETPQLRKTIPKAKHAHFALPEQPCGDAEEPSANQTVKHESFSELLSEPDIQYAIKRHDAKSFDWVLSLPRDAGNLAKNKHLRRICSDADLADTACQNRKVYFGCNLLRQRSQSRSSVTGGDRTANSYTFIATPLSYTAASTKSALRETMVETLLSPGSMAPLGKTLALEQNTALPEASGALLDMHPVDRSQSAPRSPCSSVSRIEDTIEELDRLEDQFEAVHRMVRVDRVPSPDKEDVTAVAEKAGANASIRTGAKTNTLRTSKQYDLSRTAPVRKPMAAKDPSKHISEAASAAAAGISTKRLSVARPLSLLPPKPPTKSAKPPTRSTFELPGEAVARRLKEQREARILAAAAAAPAAPIATQHRKVRASRPLTIPKFELPGEAISRRKRQEHEAKLRQQEEEERKRREFKARPVRLSITPSSVPRDTVSSRARQNRVSAISENAIVGGGLNVPSLGPSTNKRLSMMSTEASGRATGQIRISRGRNMTLESSSSATEQTSRAASTSTGSISGKRSSVSVEDVQYQKIRGKQIFQRDNNSLSDREREKREREALTKQARQEASERSRVLSREWAEKQKQKQKQVAPATTIA